MPKLQLTDIALRSLNPPQSGQETYWDSKLSGFGCRVSQGGQKTFIVMHGPREARRRRVVGKYPLTSLKDAREEAKKLMAGITLGVIEEAPKKSILFSEARKLFLEQAAERIKPRTVADYRRLLNRHFALKGKKLSEITKYDLQQSLSKLLKTPSEHKHAYVAIRIFFNWAYREELVDQNPADRLRAPRKTPSRERVLDGRELSQVFSHAQEHPWPYGAIVALCILTGQRRGEIAMLEWDWIDFEEQTINWPGERVKNGRSHKIPFGSVTKAILLALPRFDQFVFPGGTETSTIFNGWGKSKKRFDEQLENVAPYTLHDLRRTFSTNHAKMGTPIHVTEKLLNHVSGSFSGVAAVYNRYSYMTEMKIAVEAYESKLTNRQF